MRARNADFWKNPENTEEVFTAYEKDYPGDPLGAYLVKRRVIYYTDYKPENLIPMLRQLTASPNTATARSATEESVIAERFNQELYIPAVWLVGRDGVAGKVYDLAKLEKSVGMAVTAGK